MDSLALRVYRWTSSMTNGQTENLDVLSYQAKAVMTIIDSEVIKSFFMLNSIKVKIPTIASILTFISIINTTSETLKAAESKKSLYFSAF